MHIYKLPEIHYGIEKRNKVFEILKQYNSRSLFFIIDSYFESHPFIQQIKEQFTGEIIVFTAIDPDPSIQNALLAIDAAREKEIDCVLAIGGGSALDVAKVVAVMLNNTQDIYDMIGVNNIPQRSKPLILMPTTAGTGTEVTPISILTDTKNNLKLGVVSSYLIPEVAVLDPELSLSLPPKQTAYSGMDALIHAMEAYISVNATPYTDILAEKAVRIISQKLPLAYNDLNNIDLRSDLLLGSMIAGQAFANAGVAAVHAFSYPIGAKYHIPHGLANCLMLIPVFRFNQSHCKERFQNMVDWMNTSVDIVETLEHLIQQLDIPQSLSMFGAKKEDIPFLSEAVLKLSRLLNNNPKTVGLEDAHAIYQAAF